MHADGSRRVLLLIEDNPSDVDLIRALLEDSDMVQEILHRSRLADAVDLLKGRKVDVVLLDLRLPDETGIDTLKTVRAANERVPIVVLTGNEDEELAISCIDAGAQDYLFKRELRRVPLQRTIGYAITRQREAEIRDLRETLDRLRGLTSGASHTSVTALVAGTGSIQSRRPALYSDLLRAYTRLLSAYMHQLVLKRAKPREEMAEIVTRLGDEGGGPRDLIDLHVGALDAAVKDSTSERGRALAIEGRLLALEMMGLLVDFYRVGLRRLPSDGGGP